MQLPQETVELRLQSMWGDGSGPGGQKDLSNQFQIGNDQPSTVRAIGPFPKQNPPKLVISTVLGLPFDISSLSPVPGRGGSVRDSSPRGHRGVSWNIFLRFPARQCAADIRQFSGGGHVVSGGKARHRFRALVLDAGGLRDGRLGAGRLWLDLLRDFSSQGAAARVVDPLPL